LVAPAVARADDAPYGANDAGGFRNVLCFDMPPFPFQNQPTFQQTVALAKRWALGARD
jgi:hypothetical protein